VKLCQFKFQKLICMQKTIILNKQHFLFFSQIVNSLLSLEDILFRASVHLRLQALEIVAIETDSRGLTGDVEGGVAASQYLCLKLLDSLLQGCDLLLEDSLGIFVVGDDAFG
jgi:hypothetical protein